MGALRASGRVGVIAGAAKLGISLVLALVRRRNLSAVVAPGMLADHARFGVSAAMVTLIARSIRCLLARVRGVDDARGRALAAAVGGAATIVDAPSRRDDIAVYLLCVAVHANALRAVRNGALPSWQHASAAVFVLATIPIYYALYYRPDTMDATYYNFTRRIANVDHDVLTWTLRQEGVAIKPGTLGHSISGRADTQIPARLPSGAPCEVSFPALDLGAAATALTASGPRFAQAATALSQAVALAETGTSAAAAMVARHAAVGLAALAASAACDKAPAIAALPARVPWVHASIAEALDVVAASARAAATTSSSHVHSASPAPGIYHDCRVVYHPAESCGESALTSVPGLFARTLAVYIPIHVLPLLLTKARETANAPIEAATRVAIASVRSAAFLSAFTLAGRLALCNVRPLLVTLPRPVARVLTALACGLSSGGAIFIESPQRRTALAVYVASKAVVVLASLASAALNTRTTGHSSVRRVSGDSAATIGLALALFSLAHRGHDVRGLVASSLDALLGPVAAAPPVDAATT